MRTLITTCRRQKVSMTGKGKLTQDKMAKIQNYYGRAIKDNVHDIDLMKKKEIFLYEQGLYVLQI